MIGTIIARVVIINIPSNSTTGSDDQTFDISMINPAANAKPAAAIII